METAAHVGADPYLAHHFDSKLQQREAVSLGMWLFLVTEVMFFGGIFVGYSVYRMLYPESFHEMSKHLDVFMGTLNTTVLLTSSLTMAFAVNAAQVGNKARLVRMLWITFALSLVFLVVKYFEYSAKFEHHLVPGKSFSMESALGHHTSGDAGHHGVNQTGAEASHVGAAKGTHSADPDLDQAINQHLYGAKQKETLDERAARGAQIFFSFYFGATGLHGFHVFIGTVLIAIFAVMAGKGKFPKERYQPVEMLGLYWHFVDLIWIYVFPLFYLIGQA